ncbi:MAG: hypothetical protein GF364_17390 [Candidatus Lokiarchaeota archaeon]|nr:hypothetical protein [Candidatus Lokiarchaeota archaeon]
MQKRKNERSARLKAVLITYIIFVILSTILIPITSNTAKNSTELRITSQLLENASSLGQGPQNFSTYIGGSMDDMVYDVDVDDQGNVYICGSTKSSDFYVSENSYNDTYGGDTDCYVSKISADGSEVIWSTFIGGPQSDLANSLKVLADGSVIVCGESRSVSFPTTEGAYDESHNGGSDIVVFKISSDGSDLLFSTFIGGSADESTSDLDINSNGIICIAGTTAAADFPTTGGAYNASYGTNVDVCIMELSANGQNLLYATYLGGFDYEDAREVEYTADDKIIVCGSTKSVNFPVTASAYNDTLYAGTYDVYLTKFNSDASDLEFSTFIGGSGDDWSYSFELCESEDILVHGKTYSTDFPLSTGAYDDELTGLTDAFLFKISKDGSTMMTSTFYGGDGGESGGSVSIDSDGRIYISGITGSTDLNITDDAMQKNIKGTYDMFITEFLPDLSDITYGTYIGSSGTDSAYWSCIDCLGYFNLVGYSNDIDFPTTDGAFNTTHNGGRDVVVIKFPRYPITSDPFPFLIVILVIAAAFAITVLLMIVKKRKKKKSKS